uniref:Sestrin-1-like isoform X2 n=2 Tax=Crassostrea virginica TaxID=6565 RepID=A0A8B8ANI2_CRAVI|nr:sestrin-1-like isoform X2 [Crassostrea virginica]XP_022292203.1 sestrin-1-like isoform X2 [Crassostrea virginica]
MQSHSQLKCDDATLFPYTNVFTPEKGKHFFPDCLEMRICVGKVLDKKPQVKMESGEPSEVLSEDDLSLLECLRAILSETQMLFVDAFLQNNRLDHVTQLMGYHPNYLEMFLRTQQYLLRGDGPLPFHYRHYIAIMAASRHQCAYLIHLHEQEFILQGGDQEWLKGPAYIPTKLRKLQEVNKILAHRPWLFNKTHIEGLRKEAWSVSELVQAIVIMAHFHALSSFVFGCGIKNEPDHHGGFTYRPHSPTENSNDSDYTSDCSSDSNSEPEVGIEILMERMKKLKESQEEEPTEEERRKRFEKVETQSAELTKPGKKPSVKAEIVKYCQDEDFNYIDFTKRGCTDEAPTFRANEYSWDDHGFSIANRLYSEIGNLLDEKFSMAYNLTYYTMGEVIDVDTSAFRRAIWYYIHCLYGIMHDDYDYGQVNQLLERNLKAYIKTVTCYPERLTKKDYDNVMKEFKHSEKVHVNLMLLEARLQGELLYALRGVMQYMT